MTINIAGRSVALGAIVAAVGGLIGIIGAFLVWAQLTVGAGMASAFGTVNNGIGLDERAGKVALGLGIIALVLAVVWALEVKIPMLPALVAGVGVLILVMVALTYFTTLLSKDRSLKDALDLANQAIDSAKALGADTSGTSAGPGIGFLLEIVAGVVVIVGGGLGLMKKSA
jgi:putative copper export protein